MRRGGALAPDTSSSSLCHCVTWEFGPRWSWRPSAWSGTGGGAVLGAGEVRRMATGVTADWGMGEGH